MEGSSELMMAAPGRSFSLLRRWLLRDSDPAPGEGSGVASWWETVSLESGFLDMAAMGGDELLQVGLVFEWVLVKCFVCSVWQAGWTRLEC